MPVTGGYGRSGIFDEIACVNGYFLGIEYKATPAKHPTVLQQINAAEAAKSGGLALVIHCDNLDLLRNAVAAMQAAPAPAFFALSNFPTPVIPKLMR